LKPISLRGLSLDGLQVLDGARATQIVEVLSDSPIAGSTALAATDVSEAMLDRGALAELVSPLSGPL